MSLWEVDDDEDEEEDEDVDEAEYEMALKLVADDETPEESELRKESLLFRRPVDDCTLDEEAS